MMHQLPPCGCHPRAIGMFTTGRTGLVSHSQPPAPSSHSQVAVRFDERPARSSASSWFRAAASGAPDWSYTTTLSQAGRSIHHTTTIEDAVSERPLFPKAGSYRVSFTGDTA